MARPFVTKHQASGSMPEQETQPPDYHQFVRDNLRYQLLEGQTVEHVYILYSETPLLISRIHVQETHRADYQQFLLNYVSQMTPQEQRITHMNYLLSQNVIAVLPETGLRQD